MLPVRAKLKQHLLCLILLTECFVSVFPSSVDILLGATREHRAHPRLPNVGHLGPLRTLALWQLPAGTPRKVLLILHGRNVSPYNYFDYSATCPKCSGHPEETKIVRDALLRSYAVFVPDSLVEDGDWEAWPQDSRDLENMLSIFADWRRAEGLESSPVVALGISAGGSALSTVALRTGLFESVVLMISHGETPSWDIITEDYPATLFVHMPRDSATAAEIAAVRHSMEAKGVINDELTWTEQAITDDWFSSAIPRLVDLEMSRRIVDALIADDLLDGRNSRLKSDAYYWDWRDRVRRWKVFSTVPPHNATLLLEDSILEELMVAYALHVTVARMDEIIFAWLDGDYDAVRRSKTASLPQGQRSDSK